MPELRFSAVLSLTLACGAACVHASGIDRARATRATNEDAAALVQLAQRYDRAEGGGQDFAKANELYCRAARLGDAEAQFRLGWIYAAGRGVPRDTKVAAELFAMAAEGGHEHARRRVRSFPRRPGTKLPPCLQPERIVRHRPIVRDAPSRHEVEALVRRLAPQYAIDPQLVIALIAVESNFDPKAVSRKNAQGLMQLVPETAERFGVKQVFDPVDNVKGGLAYLRWLMAFFQGDVRLVLAAYNAGERAVERHNGIPPYDETRAYVARITSIYRKARHPYDASLVPPSPTVIALRRGNNR